MKLEQHKKIKEAETNIDQEIISCQRLIEQKPDIPHLYLNLAKLYTKKKQYNQAITAYQQAINLKEDLQAWVYGGLGEAFEKENQIDNAVSAYQKALEVDSVIPRFYLSLIRLTKVNENISDDSAKWCEKAINLDLDIPIWVYIQLAEYNQSNGKLNEAVNLFKKAAKIYDPNYGLYLRLANSCCELKDYDDAINYYIKAITLKSDVEPWVYRRLERLLSIKNQMNKYNNIDRLVSSFGGVGTSFFVKFLSGYFQVNDNGDKDGIKHLDIPPRKKFNQNFKAVYIYGNPYNAVLSLFRRGFQFQQSCKLLARHASISPIVPSCTLEKYLDLGQDRLKLEQHFNNWLNAKVDYPILLVKYEKIWDNLPEIFEFLEISKEEMINFPVKKERKSEDYTSLPRNLQEKLYNMYGNLYNQMNELKAIIVVKPKL